MKYTGIDQERLSNLISIDKNDCKKARGFLVLVLLGIVLTGYFLLMTMNNTGASDYAAFQTGMLGCIFSATFVIGIIMYLYGRYYKVYRSLRKNIKRLKKDICLELIGDTIVYTENKTRVQRIANIEDVQMDDNQFIQIKSGKEHILIDGYINNASKILGILQFITAVNQAKYFENKSFKQLIELNDSNHSVFYNEVKQMNFLLPVTFTLEHFSDDEDCITLSSGVSYKYETIKFNDVGKYICIYSNHQEINSDYFNNQLIMSYQDIFELIVNNSLDIFNDADRLMGIVINPHSDQLVLTMNKKV